MKQKLSILCIVVVLALSACGSQTTSEGGSTPPQPQATPASQGGSGGGGSSATTVSANVSLDPALATDEDSRSLVKNSYEGLVAASNGETTPALAESWSVSDDKLDYIFNLRVGVKFHDGSSLDADAAVKNFNRWFDPADSLHGSGAYDAWKNAFSGFKGEVGSDGVPTSAYDGTEKVDVYTVLVHLNRPDDAFLTKISDPAFSIVSPAALAAKDFGARAGVDGGTGPYTFVWGDKGLQFEPFAGYWNQSAVPASGFTVEFK